MEKILIIGGGIGGLALSLFLKKINIDCKVYEAYSYKENIGGGLNIAPNGMNVLDEINLAASLYERGSIALENCFRNENGKIIARYKNADTEKYGLPAVSLMRHELFEVLLHACREEGIDVFFERQLIDIKQDDKIVTAFFKDGTEASAEILIGADGVNSKTRELIFPTGPRPSYVGLIATGGIVKSKDIPLVTTREKQSLNFTFGPKGFFGYMGIRHGDVLWWANLPSDQELRKEELSALTVERVKFQMSQIYSGFNNTVRELISSSYASISYNIFDMPSLEKWHMGRVLLIGDAAHAVSPNAGQGASLALEDAMYLAKILKDKFADYENAFKEFELARKTRAEKVVQEGRKRGNDKKELTPGQSKIREKVMGLILRLFGTKFNEWLYTYRIR